MKWRRSTNWWCGGIGEYFSIVDCHLGILMNQLRQIFPLYVDPECLPSRDSVLAMIHQKRLERKEIQNMEHNQYYLAVILIMLMLPVTTNIDSYRFMCYLWACDILWSGLKWASATTREVGCSLRAHTGTQDQSVKGNNNNNSQDWNHHQQLQGKWDVVWENLLGHWIRVQRAMTMAKAEMNISDDKGSGKWSESTYWDTGSECKGRKWWPRLKSPSATTGKVGHGLRELTGTLDQSVKGDDNGQGWNEHQQQQGKWDMVWEHVLGHRIRARRATTMAKTEITISNYRESRTWFERTYWDTGSEHKGWWQWPQLKWTPVMTREGWYGLRALTGTLDQSAKGDNDDQSWNAHLWWQQKCDAWWVTWSEYTESTRSELVLVFRIIISTQCDKCDKDSPFLAAMR